MNVLDVIGAFAPVLALFAAGLMLKGRLRGTARTGAATSRGLIGRFACCLDDGRPSFHRYGGSIGMRQDRRPALRGVVANDLRLVSIDVSNLLGVHGARSGTMRAKTSTDINASVARRATPDVAAQRLIARQQALAILRRAAA